LVRGTHPTIYHLIWK